MRLFGAPVSVGIAAAAACATALVFFLGAIGFRLWHYGYFGDSLMDDAFFFVRYAGNFLDTGVFEWNHGEGPVHGNTAQLYQFMIAGVYWLLDRNIILTISLTATLGSIAYLVLMPLAYLQARPGIERPLRLLVCVLIVVLVCFDGQIFLLLGTGMETTWAMALVALSLIAAFRIENGHAGPVDVLLCGLSLLLVYAVRPDALVMALAAPAGIVLFSPQRRVRHAGLAVCATATGLIAAFILGCWLYYGDALPLAVFAKTTELSAMPLDGRGATVGYSPFYLGLTVLLHAPEVVLALAALFFFPRLSPVLRGAALGMAAFSAYHLLLVVPIMGYFGRFHAPMLPVLTLLAARGAETILARSRIAQGFRAAGSVGMTLIAGLGLLVAYKIVPTAARVVSSHLPALQAERSINTKAGAAEFVVNEFPFFRGRMVEMVKALGKDCSIASTEDGILSAFAHANRIVDISGLHDREMAHNGFSADRLLLQQKPDVLAMPHPWYKDWTRDIERHPAFTRDYISEAAFVETGQVMAFRRDSPCALRVRQVLYGK